MNELEPDAQQQLLGSGRRCCHGGHCDGSYLPKIRAWRPQSIASAAHLQPPRLKFVESSRALGSRPATQVA